MEKGLNYKGKVIRLSSDDFLYVHKGDVRTLHCYRNNHCIVPVTAIVAGIDGREYAISVRYCAECDEYFISRISYDLYIEKLGFMLARFEDYERAYSQRKNNFSNFRGVTLNDTSPLSLMGYTVDDREDTPDEVRHAFLSMAMDRGFLTKDTIQLYLEQFLRINAQKAQMLRAEEKWKSDLVFVLQYNIEQQPKAFIGAVTEWQKRRKHKMQPYDGVIDIDNTIIQEEYVVSKEKGICDHKDGDVKVIIRGEKEFVRLYVENYLTKEARDYLYAYGWKWDKYLKCWYHTDRDFAYGFAYMFLSGYSTKN